LSDALARLADVLGSSTAGPDSIDALREAELRARRIHAIAGRGAEAVAGAALVYVGEVVARLGLEREWTEDQLLRIVDQAADVLEVESTRANAGIFGSAVNSTWFFELPPRLSADFQLKLLVGFAPVREVSLWTADQDGIDCEGAVGVDAPSRRVRRIAAETLSGGAPVASAGAHLYGVPVVQWDRPSGAIVLRTQPQDRERALGYAGETARALIPILEKAALLQRSARREESLVESAERRRVRLGFDLHDGVLQDLLAVAADLRLLRQPSTSGDGNEHLEGLAARVIAVERQIRELVQTLEVPTGVGRPIEELVQIELDRLESNGIATSLRVHGTLDGFSMSQRIALLRFVEEALENVKSHSRASRVVLALATGHTTVKAEVTDDGCGFDVERVLVQAAQGGRLGLVGMGERIRLLGGRLDIASRPGGPTSITAVLPRWKPSASDAV
jgi:signal transduction histidine kinase